MISVIDVEVAGYVDDLHTVNEIIQNIMDDELFSSSKTVNEQCAQIEQSIGIIFSEFHRMGYMHKQRSESKRCRPFYTNC